MRIATQVLMAYGLILVIGSLWHALPLGRVAPDVVALSAVYLGLTARNKVAPSTLGAVVLGYLGDLLFGTPRGMLALSAGVVCILGHIIHRRLLVRGWLITLGVAFFTGLASGLIGLVLRIYAGHSLDSAGAEIRVLLLTALFTAALGPLVFRLCRMIDARFARTLRERDAVS